MDNGIIKFKAFIKKSNHTVDVIGIDLDSEFGGVYVWGKAYQGHDDGEHEADKDFYTWPEIDLIQFIGLLDRHGKDIYDKDVIRVYNWGVKTSSDVLGTTRVVWDVDERGWRYEEDLGAEDVYDQFRNVEVLGSSLEHPELLEK